MSVLSSSPVLRAQPADPLQPRPSSLAPWGLRLTYRTTAGCLDEETFRHAVALFFDGADPFNEDSPEDLHVTFTRLPGGFRATVQRIPAQGDPWPEEKGKISPTKAADMTATVLTHASGEVMHSRPSWVPALFCIKLRERMEKMFDEAYPNLGATVASQ